MLLKRLRDTMARAESVEVTLGEVVRLVANEMVAEVCSIYLLRAGEVLELFATQGLNPSAVHSTRLRVGEGLVGDIAAHGRPLALDDAQREALAEAMTAVRQGGTFRMQKGYDHSYFFVSTFMEEHVAFHAAALHA